MKYFGSQQTKNISVNFSHIDTYNFLAKVKTSLCMLKSDHTERKNQSTRSILSHLVFKTYVFEDKTTKHYSVRLVISFSARSPYFKYFLRNYLLVNDRIFRASWSVHSQFAFTCSSFTKQPSVYEEIHNDLSSGQTSGMTKSYTIVLSEIQLVCGKGLSCHMEFIIKLQCNSIICDKDIKQH